MGKAKHSTRSTTARAGNVPERILDAAVAILRTSGLQRLTQVQVAERAAVRQSHLTYYFPTRDDLLTAVTARAVGGIAGALRHAVQDQEGSPAGLVLEHLARSVADLEHMRMFLGLIVEADGDRSLRRLLVDGTRQLVAAIADALGDGSDHERARLLLAAVWGLGLYQFVIRPPADADPSATYLTWLTEVSGAPHATTTARKRSRRR